MADGNTYKSESGKVIHKTDKYQRFIPDPSNRDVRPSVRLDRLRLGLR